MTRLCVFVGLGANLGDPVSTLRQAAAAMVRWTEVRHPRGSSLYRSAPIDSGGPDYWNAVLAFEVDAALTPAQAHARLQALERAHGRERPYRNAPRTLDLDLLAWGADSVATPNLQVPHPRLHRRAFVLHPLLEVAPGLVLPGLGALDAYLPDVVNQAIERSGQGLLSQAESSK